MKFFVGFLFLLSLFLGAFCSCPNGSVGFQNSCYYFFSNATQFPDAELACMGINGHLASIHDGFTNAILTSESSKYFHDSTTVDFWIGLNSLMSPGNWSWTDNTTFDFKDWAPTEPKNISMSCSALTIQNGYWASADCFMTKPYVCQTSATPSYPAYMNCTEGWVYFEPTHSCYGHDGYSYRYGKWSDGEQYCERVDAHLISLHSYDEARFLSTVLQFYGISIWTGLISYDNEVSWKWSDDSPVDYLPWASGAPNKNVSSCVYLYENAIYDYNCTTTFYIVCKKTGSSVVVLFLKHENKFFIVFLFYTFLMTITTLIFFKHIFLNGRVYNI